MKVTFFGVRGSIASPGPETVKYGGNTPCVLVEVESISTHKTTTLIFDAGTGIRSLGSQLSKTDTDLYLFFSHYHWDHIQGFPFFSPAYQHNRNIYLIKSHLDNESTSSVLDQMIDPHFPVTGDQLQANINELALDTKGEIVIDDVNIRTLALNHPGGGIAFRMDSQQGSVTYVTDNELFPPGKAKTSYDEWVNFVAGTDLLIHDAMYQDKELERIHGWGHSLISQTMKLAHDANVANLALFHHEPSRTDQQLDEILADCKQEIASSTGRKVFIAKEGDSYFVTDSKVMVENNTLDTKKPT